MVEPKAVTRATDDYRRESDIMREYQENNIEVINNKKKCILKSVLWKDFKEWHKDYGNSTSLPSNKKLYGISIQLLHIPREDILGYNSRKLKILVLLRK